MNNSLHYGDLSNYNVSTNATAQSTELPKWGVLALIVIILATALGNLLVCLAVCRERRLQNTTNYFLMSLAIADLLVSILVMPLGMIVEMYGKWSACFSQINAIRFYVNVEQHSS